MSRRNAKSSVPSPTSLSATSDEQRFDRLDALRGLALVWMAVFHFCFDLSHAGLINANFYEDPWWTTQRTCILSLFLLCAGAGQAVAVHQGQTWPRFWRRWSQVLGCAVLVSAGSYLMFPGSFIYFGVLHGMAVMLIMARLTAQCLAHFTSKWASSHHPMRHLSAWALVALGALAMALPNLLQHPMFDTPWLNWTGLVTHKPITEDYVPLLPWMGVMWWGVAATQWMLTHRPHWLKSLPIKRLPWQGLAWLGMWSLTFYMVHQPVLLGALDIYQYTTGTSP
jgi:uncharacterized membrane protein